MTGFSPLASAPLAAFPFGSGSKLVVTNNRPTGDNVSPNSHVSFDIIDTGTKLVDRHSITVTINGVIVHQNDADLHGFLTVVTPIFLGFHVDVTSPIPWDLQATISVQANATELTIPMIPAITNKTGSVGVPFSFTPSIINPSSLSITWSLQAGTLPGGLSLNSSTGTISGTDGSTAHATGLVLRASFSLNGVASNTDSNAFVIDIV